MKKFILLILSSSLSLFCPSISAQDISQTLIGHIIEKSLPEKLYQHKNQAWSLGTYSITVDKAGVSEFNSDKRHLYISMPMKITMKAVVKQTILNSSYTLKCHSDFNSHGKLVITPTINQGINVTSQLSLPIPQASLNCGDISMPIEPLLEQLVKEKTPQWQKKISDSIEKGLQSINKLPQ